MNIRFIKKWAAWLVLYVLCVGLLFGVIEIASCGTANHVAALRLASSIATTLWVGIIAAVWAIYTIVDG